MFSLIQCGKFASQCEYKTKEKLLSLFSRPENRWGFVGFVYHRDVIASREKIFHEWNKIVEESHEFGIFTAIWGRILIELGWGKMRNERVLSAFDVQSWYN
jgi:hypothetical protein